jgi:regulator of replication initiation timing
MTAVYLDNVESLSERIAELVRQRQDLRATAADAETLEQNRLEIARMQQHLSEALIREYRPAAA